MRVLVACEFSGLVRDAFIQRGHVALSCDLIPTERPGPHYQGDVRTVLGWGWDLLVAHPPCRYLSGAGVRWWSDPTRQAPTAAAVAFVRLLANAPVDRIAIENPRGLLTRLWRGPDQIIHPYYFGEPYQKATCLWLKGLPPLMATLVEDTHPPYLPMGTGEDRRRGYRWSPGTPGARGKGRSRTFPGIAQAMAAQWGET